MGLTNIKMFRIAYLFFSPASLRNSTPYASSRLLLDTFSLCHHPASKVNSTSTDKRTRSPAEETHVKTSGSTLFLALLLGSAAFGQEVLPQPEPPFKGAKGYLTARSKIRTWRKS